jgi:hypothetical protein
VAQPFLAVLLGFFRRGAALPRPMSARFSNLSHFSLSFVGTAFYPINANG